MALKLYFIDRIRSGGYGSRYTTGRAIFLEIFGDLRRGRSYNARTHPILRNNLRFILQVAHPRSRARPARPTQHACVHAWGPNKYRISGFFLRIVYMALHKLIDSQATADRLEGHVAVGGRGREHGTRGRDVRSRTCACAPGSRWNRMVGGSSSKPPS